MPALQTTLCYLEKDGCYLMLHRVKKKKDVNKDKWIGVGGKLEPGEDALACVRREVWEETGCTLGTPLYRGILDFACPPWEPEQIHLFTCTDFTAPAALPDCPEGELRWVKKADIPALPLWRGDLIFLNLLAENAPFFRLGLTYDGDTLTRAVLNGTALQG